MPRAFQPDAFYIGSLFVLSWGLGIGRMGNQILGLPFLENQTFEHGLAFRAQPRGVTSHDQSLGDQ